MPVIDRDDLERGLEALCEAYPKTFFRVGRMRRPLKKNIVADIGADLRERPDSELIYYDIKTVVDWYCNHVGYWFNSGVAGAIRLDLDGQPAGKITEAEARDAKQRGDEIYAAINAKKDRRTVNGSPVLPMPPLTPVLMAPQVDAAMTDHELLASIERHVGSLKILASLPNDIQQVSARPVVLLLIDELKTLDARITKGVGE